MVISELTFVISAHFHQHLTSTDRNFHIWSCATADQRHALTSPFGLRTQSSAIANCSSHRYLQERRSEQTRTYESSGEQVGKHIATKYNDRFRRQTRNASCKYREYIKHIRDTSHHLLPRALTLHSDDAHKHYTQNEYVCVRANTAYALTNESIEKTTPPERRSTKNKAINDYEQTAVESVRCTIDYRSRNESERVKRPISDAVIKQGLANESVGTI